MTSLLLAIIMLLQIVVPQNIFAEEDNHLPHAKSVKVGTLNANSYDAKIMNELNRIAAKNRKPRSVVPGTMLFSTGPYFGKDNEPTDENKPKYYGNISVDFKTEGLDGNPFQWNEIFGVDEEGNPKPAQIIFTQSDHETGDETGVEYILKVTATGKYTWQDKNGNPTKLPLFSKKLKPYSYEVRVDEDVAENIKLLTARMTGTEGSSPTFSPENTDGEIIANITLELGLHQVASTKFKSEWHTSVEESARPQIKGTIEEKVQDLYDHPVSFDLPKNDTDANIIRDWEDAFVEGLIIADALYNTPNVKLDETNANGLTFEEKDGVKTVKSGDKTYKYDFKYDVINGGKLTMTEIIPVTFDANGGKFDSITEPNADQKIVKEVDYGNDLTDKVEVPKKALETFKGWATAKDGTPLSKEEFDEAIKNITKAKTFYAIWNNNETTAEELEVKESFKNGTDYINDFIPKLADLKKQVKIKVANGDPQALTDDDTFEILNDSGTAITGAALKNYLYGKLQEKDNPKGEPTRVETVKSKVTFANNTSQTVDIPIKVIKNIYEAKTLTEKPYYVPGDYVKVILDPTTKATEPQKTYYYVNKEAKVVIPGDNPTGIDNYTFEKWLIKGTTTEYKLKEKPRHQFTANETTIEAQYVSNIIPAKADVSKPDGFVLVEFKAGDNGSIANTETTKYWVKPNAGIKLSDITHPTIKANNGWKANGWDKVDTTPITGATEVKAQYLAKVVTIEPTQNRDKYVKVEFKQGAHGTIANTEKTQYWVLKQEEVDLKEPTVTPKTGYAQKTGDNAWSPKVAKYYYEDTVHIAQYDFNGKDVIEQPDPNVKPDVPQGYVLVEFSAGNDGKFEANQTTKYWVNPNKEVTLPEPQIKPNTGYKQQDRLNAWDKPLTKTFTETTTITAQYEALGDILTEKKPGYVEVVFKAGTNGTLDGTTVYWVNPLKNKTLGDITHPSVSPKTGLSHNGWDKADTTAIDNTANPLVVTAKYLEKVLKAQPIEDPGKYVTVEFTKGTHGEIKTGETAKYWVLKDAEVSLTAPAVTPATGYAQKSGDDAWSPKQATKYSANTEHVAQYVYTGKDVVPAGPNGSKPDGTPDNFVLVTFDKGDHGSAITGQTQYWVNPNKEVTLTAASVTANQGYEQKPGFNAWDHYLTATFKDTTTITAQYNKLGDILTEEKSGYVKVEFKPGTNGTLDGTTVYWVNPDAKKKLSDIRHPNVTANDHYKHIGWDVAEDTVIEEAKEVTAKYLKDVLTSNPSDTINYVKVTFDPGAHGTIAGQAEYWVLKNTEVSIAAPTVTPDTAKGFKQKDSKDAWSPEIATAYSKDTTHVAQYEYQGQNVIPAKPDGSKPDNVPDDFVKVTFKPTDKAATNVDKIFWVKPNELLMIPIAKPEGKKEPVSQTNPKAYEWQFTKWVSEETKSRTWEKNIDDGVTAIFTADTDIKAEYKKVITDQGTVVANEITVHESFKNGDTWVNNFIDEAKEDILKASLKRTTATGVENLPDDATVTLLDDSGNAITGDALKNALYEKLQEKDDGNKPSRRETLKAKVTFQNGEKQTVDIPIKVIKNIYEAKTKEGKPNYVPEGYVKVTVDPTTKATDPQKYSYYVNPEAKVVIPENNPVGVGDNKFVKWTMKEDTATGDGTEYKLKDKPRTQFEKASTITAQYVSDVIPQDGTTKPDYVPANYVEVKFVPTNKATDETKAEKIFWVNPDKEVTIPVKDPTGKQYFTFKEWKIGVNAEGAVYTPTAPKKFTDATTITATYKEAENIISYNPEEPITRPDGYVRITFAADPGLKLTEQKAYYVKANAGVTLGNTELNKPGVNAETGYKQKSGADAWDKEDSLEIEATDIVVTAKAIEEPDSIPKLKDDGSKNTIPNGYVEVKFVAGENGNLVENNTKIEEKVFYVNPNKYVKLTPPTDLAKEETGYKFGSWNKDATIPTVYKTPTEIVASFNQIKDVIPKTRDDDSEKPDGYLTVTFKITGEGGNIVDGQNKVYFVDPTRKVKIQPPTTEAKVGYKFKNWNKDTTIETQYSDNTEIIGTFEKQKDIIPSTNDQGNPNPKPNGYVTVTFEKGTNGKSIEGKTVYYVNPEADPTKTLAAITTKPTVKAEVGYKFTGWDTKDDFEIKDNKTVIAQYESIDDVIPKNKPTGGENTKPEDYITVTFEKGANGELEGNTIFYINPNKAVVLEDKAPTVKPNTGYTSAGWDTTINKAIQYKDGDKITALYNDPGNISTTKVEGYAIVEFKTDAQGTLAGTIKYWVKPNVSVNVPAPNVNPNDGYKFKEWDKSLTVNLQAGATYEITAKYEYLGDIIPQEKTDGTDKPNGYVTVKFEAVNGTLSGTKVYYVNPNKEVDLTNTAKAITKRPDVGYTVEGGTWNKKLKDKFTEGDVLTFTFNKEDDVIEIVDGKTMPYGYVRVDVIPTYFAKDPTIKSYWVNPNKEVTIPPMTIQPSNDNYKFLGWDQPFRKQFTYHTNIVAKFEIVSKPTPGYNGGGNIYIGGGNLYIGGTTEKIVEVPAKAKALRKAVRYMQGFNGYFRPNDGLTRAEAAQILANALVEDGYNYNPNYQISYPDIGNEWYTRAIKITTEANVFAGYDDGLFRPEKKITRAEWVATLRRFQNIAEADGNHMNLSGNHWAKAEIEGAYNEGWLKIYTDGLAKFNADEFIPRQEVAAVSNRAFKRVFDKTYIDRNDNALINQYKDIKPSMWAYEDILCASNTFVHDEQLYRAHDVKNDKLTFNVDLGGLEIIQDKFQRILR